MTAQYIDRLPLSHSDFNSPLPNARGCDLFKSSRCTHKHAHRSIRSVQRYGEEGIFHVRLGHPCTFPRGHTHTTAVGGFAISLPDSTVPVEIMYYPLPGARPKSINRT